MNTAQQRAGWAMAGLALALVAACALALTPAAAAARGPVASAARGPLASAARVGRAPASQRLQIVIPLLVDQAALRRFALAVSTPGSPQYGQYASIPELAARFGASARTRARAVRFLRRAGASKVRIDATGLFADAVMPAGTAEHVFATSLARFRTARGAVFTAPSAPVSLPAGLRGVATGVVGLDTQSVTSAPAVDRMPTTVRSAQAQDPSGYAPATGTPSGCSSAIATGGFTPNQYLTAYGYDPLHAGGTFGQGERVALIEIDGFKQSDISAFARCFGLRLPEINGFAVGSLSSALRPGGESTLDLEVLDAAAPGLKAIDVYEAKSDAANTLLALAAPLKNRGYKPQVISASLGLCEQFTYEAVRKSGLALAEGELEEAAASGITFLAASGDDGSADCTQGSTPIRQLAVNYPASSWWATAVGGTNIALNAQNAITNQIVWNDAAAVPGAAGGGGASVVFNRPSWQNGTVPQNSRVVPDVSMLADIAPGYAVYCTATPDCVNSSAPNPWQSVGGTSAATPLLAGGFALVDQVLRTHQLQDLGLANPLLYKIGRSPSQAAAVFNDVTVGNNDVGPFVPSIGAALGCCSAGPGFDEATGWGSVNLSTFSVSALATQPKIVDIAMSVPGGQRPVAHRKIVSHVTCSGRCLIGAFAAITVGHQRPFTVYSGLYHLNQAGSKNVSITLSSSRVKKLRDALRHGTRVSASVTAAIVDAGGNIERRTPSRQLRITR
jgi:kumamolisin